MSETNAKAFFEENGSFPDFYTSKKIKSGDKFTLTRKWEAANDEYTLFHLLEMVDQETNTKFLCAFDTEDECPFDVEVEEE